MSKIRRGFKTFFEDLILVTKAFLVFLLAVIILAAILTFLPKEMQEQLAEKINQWALYFESLNLGYYIKKADTIFLFTFKFTFAFIVGAFIWSILIFVYIFIIKTFQENKNVNIVLKVSLFLYCLFAAYISYEFVNHQLVFTNIEKMTNLLF